MEMLAVDHVEWRQSGSYHFGNTYPWVLISRYFRIGGHPLGTLTALQKTF